MPGTRDNQQNQSNDMNRSSERKSGDQGQQFADKDRSKTSRQQEDQHRGSQKNQQPSKH